MVGAQEEHLILEKADTIHKAEGSLGVEGWGVVGLGGGRELTGGGGLGGGGELTGGGGLGGGGGGEEHSSGGGADGAAQI